MLSCQSRETVGPMSYKQLLPLIAIFMMISVMIPFDQQKIPLENESLTLNQLGGGGGSIEDRCSSITFEDILPYTHAHFDIVGR